MLIIIKSFILHAIIILMLMFISGCASNNGYLKNRLNDSADIFTIQLGYGGGAKVRVGPIQAGLLADIGMGGLRGGELLGVSDFWYENDDSPSKMDFVAGVFGVEGFDGGPKACARGKCFLSKQVLISTPKTLLDDEQTAEDVKKRGWVYNPLPYYTQVEVVVGFLLNLRVGINPGELLDFLLGWTTVDIYTDDIGNSETKIGKIEQFDQSAPRTVGR